MSRKNSHVNWIKTNNYNGGQNKRYVKKSEITSLYLIVAQAIHEELQGRMHNRR